MATAKCSSRRAEKAASPTEDADRRRYNSVSAVSRRFFSDSEDNFSISADFSNIRDNPLFWASPSSLNEDAGTANSCTDYTARSFSLTADFCYDSEGESRGRSVERSFNGKKGIGRSLPMFRGQFWSGTACNGNYEKSNERNVISKELNEEAMSYFDECLCLSAFDNSEFSASEGPLYDLVGGVTPSDVLYPEKGSSSTLFGSEEDCGILQNQALRRKSVNSAAKSLFEMPTDSLNSDSAGSISDIRREYVIKLEESEIRAEKLRADLVVEELRRKGLDRVLMETLPKPKSSALQRSHRRRLKSNERRVMSKQLSEEAMAYFDECVSLSTFDSSDFSTSEDPFCDSVGTTMASDFSYPAKSEFDRFEDSAPSITSSICKPGSSEHYEFSFDDEPENAPIEGGVASYIRYFKKKGIDSGATTSYDAGEYRGSEGILMDRVLLNNRIKSGGLVLCCCSDVFSFQLFCG